MSKPFIQRYYSELAKFVHPNKALILFGPRQVGKTTLIEHYLAHTQYKYRLDSGDNILIQNTLNGADFNTIKEYVAGYELIVIDEAQRIPNIGQSLKIMVDQIKNLRVIVTGSSSFELIGQAGEPLTGRKTTLTLYPIAQLELIQRYNKNELKAHLPNYLIFGGYPEVVLAESEKLKRDYITEIAHSYLLKDILELDRIRNSKILVDLLRLLAFQIGNEVSFSELAQHLMIDSKTVSRYIDLLEKTFVVYRLNGFSRNLRKEITRKSKYYFYDNGIRNALIANFNPPELRDDIGKLWENFLVIERIKKQSYHGIHANNYFWRTWDKNEIDFVEEREGRLFGYEFKWGNNKRVTAPTDWVNTYKNSDFTLINPLNYLDFVL